jgi:hypothetical protein
MNNHPEFIPRIDELRNIRKIRKYYKYNTIFKPILLKCIEHVKNMNILNKTYTVFQLNEQDKLSPNDYLECLEYIKHKLTKLHYKCVVHPEYNGIYINWAS